MNSIELLLGGVGRMTAQATNIAAAAGDNVFCSY
jgi:hypothetical protein